ncbi:MAG: DEAD/DEAH box helicase [Erysipelotrichaceae bacterium]|jgi:ATP-dependent RNA helicase CshB|nr:DEAD/DEAH box helicase [Erysipelotrichaceae bacterium]
MKTFDTLTFKDSTVELIHLLGFKRLTAIQKKVIPLCRQGKNLLAMAKTGTGKTHAFLLPLAEILDQKQNALQAIIVAPTLELARQIRDLAMHLKEVLPELRIGFAAGVRREVFSFKEPPQVLIGTVSQAAKVVAGFPKSALSSIKMLVVDEADMVLQDGFIAPLTSIVNQIDNSQILFFGATAKKEELNLYRKLAKQLVVVHTSDAEFDPQILHILVSTREKSLQETLLLILPTFVPDVCLIFANSTSEAKETAAFLQSHGYDAHCHTSSQDAHQRLRLLAAMKNESVRYVVCSDVASRGLDADTITDVISLGLPKDLDYYIHRAGRTGRSGRKGTCYLLLKPSDAGRLAQLKARGIVFEERRYKNTGFTTVKKRSGYRKKKETDPDIQRILAQSSKKVKPGYKKKMREQIASVKRKKKREAIRSLIKEAQKERAKAKQRSTYQ